MNKIYNKASLVNLLIASKLAGISAGVLFIMINGSISGGFRDMFGGLLKLFFSGFGISLGFMLIYGLPMYYFLSKKGLNKLSLVIIYGIIPGCVGIVFLPQKIWAAGIFFGAVSSLFYHLMLKNKQ